MGPPIHLIPWRKTMMKNVQDQNFKPEIATQISVLLKVSRYRNKIVEPKTSPKKRMNEFVFLS